MTKKKHSHFSGLVYSTDPNTSLGNDEDNSIETLSKDKQKLRVITDSKQRAGKIVTIVTGFVGNDSDLQDLGKQLKTKCGTGGTVKEGEIVIQGNCKEKIIQWLKEWGYNNTK